MENWRERLNDERMLFREHRRDDPTCWSDRSPHGMVATAHYLATRAGVEALEAGGNAVDAAVAASLALCVCEPAGSGLGGMAMMLVHLAGGRRSFVLSGSCRAPASVPARLSRSRRSRDYTAIAVPGYARLIGHAVERYGTMDRNVLLAPAIRLAEEGFRRTSLQESLAARYARRLGRGNAAGMFLDAEGRPLAPGTRLRQPELARTLARLAETGFEDFYRGEIARRIAEDVAAGGGFVTAEDLAGLPPPEETEPLQGRFGRWEILTAPPPGGGVSLLQLLHAHEALPDDMGDPDTAEGVTHLAELIRQVRRDRRRHRLEETEGPRVRERTSARYADGVAGRVVRNVGNGETSHISVIDAEGNAVSMTQSLERSFGACVTTPGLGLLHNGYLRTFKVRNTRHPFFLRPGAEARSNAAPTLGLEDGRAALAIGSTGSERMHSGVFEVLLRLGRSSPFEAVHAPRLHCTPQGEVLLEAARFPEGTVSALERCGMRVTTWEPYSFQAGGLQLVVREGEELVGVAEPRRDGAAAGPEQN